MKVIEDVPQVMCRSVSLRYVLRSYDHHQAVSKYPNPHQQVGQWQPELEHPDSWIVVVVSIEQKGILAVALSMTGRGRDQGKSIFPF